MSAIIERVYADGGVCLKNPSPIGGSWAWLQVAHDEVLREASGHVTPGQAGFPGGTVSNNFTELLAAVLALEALPDGWCGTLYTDSQVTLYRLTGSRKFGGIPEPLRRRCQAQLARVGFVRVVLLGGHPSRKDLAAGYRRDGLPVSKFNVRADELCGLRARELAASLQPAGGAP